jgi:hypothetical protein
VAMDTHHCCLDRIGHIPEHLGRRSLLGKGLCSWDYSQLQHRWTQLRTPRARTRF